MNKQLTNLGIIFVLMSVASQICGADKNITIILLWMVILLLNAKKQ
jgi:hypothetical protein